MAINFNTGQLHDCDQIASWINTVGHGHIEYLLDSLVPDLFALRHLALVLAEDPYYSFKNVDLARCDNDSEGDIVGLVFSYPAASNQLTAEMENILSKDRVQWMRYFSDHQVNESWYINTLGVSEKFRRQGLAKALLKYASKRASQNNMNRLSLHVYENNQAAINLYESCGFAIVKKIDLTGHAFFTSRNLSANYLMKCDLSELKI
jgi:ribosomal protein S18 acetylase RimI-like enzyme